MAIKHSLRLGNDYCDFITIIVTWSAILKKLVTTGITTHKKLITTCYIFC